MGRKKNNSQYHFSKKTFPYNQFWIAYYTEVSKSGEQQDFATFIKAKSRDLSCSILKKKTKEDNPDVKIRSLRVYMLHNDLSHLSR